MKNYLFRYYKKKTRLIFASVNTMKSKTGMEDIHRLRVQIKKIRTFFHFLEIVANKELKMDNNFKTIFKYSGKLREIQLNRHYLNQYNLPPSERIPYNRYMGKEEAELKKTLKGFCEKSDTSRFSETQKKVKQLCKKTNRRKIKNKSGKFIFMEAKKIKKLQADFDAPDNIHKTRKHLKSLGAIMALLFGLTKNKALKKIVIRIKKIEVVLGNWHDKIVLINSLQKFIETKTDHVKNSLGELEKLIERMERENRLTLKTVKPKIKMISHELREGTL